MKIQSAARTALGAAVVGLIFSLIQVITMAVQLANDGYYWARIALAVVSGLKWVYIGLIVFFIFFLFRSSSLVKGAWGLGAGALVQLAFAAWNSYLLFSDPQWGEWLGSNIYLFLIELAVPLALLVFSILLARNPKGTAVRYVALLAGLALLVTIAYQVFILRQFDIFTLFDIASASFIAQWFWVLFLEWKSFEI
ncbi:MAG: hypothetical protein ACOX21_05470 [Bacillota bacterium]|jgi:hypothetical protein|nr:hypothetical protein [Bacillota bacterium]HOC06157.1 hypothetical protein [Bacillota bacterium]HPZ21896.1 hypothetical protein [Bacillota bacterium]HQD19634.1 hypothetical protein [Bacillota bacterium]